jgi:hypothetical protein
MATEKAKPTAFPLRWRFDHHYLEKLVRQGTHGIAFPALHGP